MNTYIESMIPTHHDHSTKMCTLEKRGNVFILTLTGENEHLLGPALIRSIKSALDQIRYESANKPAALVTAATGKFFSNGYDVAWAKSGDDTIMTNTNVESGRSYAVRANRIKLMSRMLRSLVTEFISFPMPTIAAVTGHAAAGGMVLALSHDYVFMRKEKGYMYMSELDRGLPVPGWYAAVVRSKVKSLTALRDVNLAAKKLTADMAVGMGIVDMACEGVERTIENALKFGEALVKKQWDGHVYAQIRKMLNVDVLNAFKFDEAVEEPNNINKYVSRL